MPKLVCSGSRRQAPSFIKVATVLREWWLVTLLNQVGFTRSLPGMRLTKSLRFGKATGWPGSRPGEI